MADFELSLRLSADGQTFVGTMRAARSEVDRVGGAMDKTGREARDLEQETTRTERAMRGLSTAAGLLRGALAAVGVGLSLRAFARAADTATNLRNRLRTVTDSSAELNDLWGRLQTVSAETFSSFQANVELYARLSRATRDLGTNQAQLITFTRAVNDAFRISGTSAQEAQAAIIQLSQGLASGVLRGDEFNSVAEQAPILLDLVAKQLNVTRGELRELAKDGEITADVIVNAVLAGARDLREEAEKLGPAVESGWQLVENAALDVAGAIDEATGASNAFAASLSNTAQRIRDLFTPVRGERDRLERELRSLQDQLENLGNARIPGRNPLFDDSRRSLEAQIRATKEAIGLLDQFEARQRETPIQAPVVVTGDRPSRGRSSRRERDLFADSLNDHRKEVEAEARELERLRRERERVAESQQEIIDNLREEIRLFGASRGEVEAYRLGLRGGTPEQQALARSLGDTVDQLHEQRDAMEESARASERFGRTLQDAFEAAIVRGDSLRDVLSNLAAQLSSMLLDNAFQGLRGGGGSGGGGLLGAVFSGIGGLFGGGGGGGFLGGSAGASILDPVGGFSLSFHDGGVVGAGGGRGRFVPAMAFAGAPRMHSGGIAGDEVPAILKRGEEVLTRNDPRHAANGGGGGVSVSQNITIDARGADQGVEQRLRVALERTKRETLALVRSEIVRGGPMRGLVRS